MVVCPKCGADQISVTVQLTGRMVGGPDGLRTEASTAVHFEDPARCMLCEYESVACAFDSERERATVPDDGLGAAIKQAFIASHQGAVIGNSLAFYHEERWRVEFRAPGRAIAVYAVFDDGEGWRFEEE